MVDLNKRIEELEKGAIIDVANTDAMTESIVGNYDSDAHLIIAREFIDNALDGVGDGKGGARRIYFDFKEKSGKYYLEMYHDGASMSDTVFFENYTRLSNSSKRGDSSSFGEHGLGSKLALVVSDGSGKRSVVRMWATNLKRDGQHSTLLFENFRNHKHGLTQGLVSENGKFTKPPNLKTSYVNGDIFGKGTQGLYQVIEFSGSDIEPFSEKAGKQIWARGRSKLVRDLAKVYRPLLNGSDLTGGHVQIFVDGNSVGYKDESITTTLKVADTYNVKVQGVETKLTYYEVDDIECSTLDEKREIYKEKYGFISCVFNGKIIENFQSKVTNFEGFMSSLDPSVHYKFYCTAEWVNPDNKIKQMIATTKEKLDEKNMDAIKWRTGIIGKVKAMLLEKYPKKSRNITNKAMSAIEMNILYDDMGEVKLLEGYDFSTEQMQSLHDVNNRLDITRRTDKLKENELPGTCNSSGDGEPITENVVRPEAGTRTPNTTCKCKHDQTKHTNDLQCTECDCIKYEKKISKYKKPDPDNKEKSKLQAAGEENNNVRRPSNVGKNLRFFREIIPMPIRKLSDNKLDSTPDTTTEYSVNNDNCIGQNEGKVNLVINENYSAYQMCKTKREIDMHKRMIVGKVSQRMAGEITSKVSFTSKEVESQIERLQRYVEKA